MIPRDTRRSATGNLFKNDLKDFINMKHPLVVLAEEVNWEKLEKEFEKYYARSGRRGLPIRLTIGLHLLKYIYALSDEEVCARWEENPYFQYFCGEERFQFRFPLERSSLTHFRKRIGEEALKTLLQESLSLAYKRGKISLKDIRRVAIDTTVQPKAIAHPTDYGLLWKAASKVRSVAKKAGITLRQSYERVLKRATIQVGRYLHAKQMKRAKKVVKYMKVRLGRLIRDVERKTQNHLEKLPEKIIQQIDKTLLKAKHIIHQKRGDPDYLYSWHRPEVECIGKGKAKTPYEFGCKVSLATNLRTKPGGKHFVLHAEALPGKPYDGHTLEGALKDLEKIIGAPPTHVFVDKGYKGHKQKNPQTQIFLSGQKRGVNPKIKREIKRRSVIEPIIGHVKNDSHMGRNYLKGQKGDQINALLSAIGFNFRQLLTA